jgi:NAD(P)-dependent dehydrogenase (short-subunit alcohol dehydrogenase family)
LGKEEFVTYWDQKVAFVTGAASGIGQASALRFAREGAFVALLDRDEEGLTRTAKQARDSARTLILVADLMDEDATAQAVEQAGRWKGRLDAVANVAGVGPPEDFLVSTREYWDAVVETNLRGTYAVAREAARHMIQFGGGGAIINVASIMGLVADPLLVTYCATKGGILSMTRAMALSLASHRIRVNAISPGTVATPLTEKWIQNTKQPEATRAKLNSVYPLGFIAEAADVAGAIVFLSGPDARCITGANLVVDCGISASFSESAIWKT